MAGITIKEHGLMFVWACLREYLGASWPILLIFAVGTLVGRLRILGDDSDPSYWSARGISACIVGIGNMNWKTAYLRESVFQRYKEAGFELLTAVHRSAVVSPDARIGPGSVVMPGAVVNSGAVIGENVIINSRAVIEHDTVVESGVHIGPGSVICGGSRIGKNSFLGAGCTVIQEICIGEEVIIGAGSTVLRNMPRCVMAAGSPAEIKRTVSQRSE